MMAQGRYTTDPEHVRIYSLLGIDAYVYIMFYCNYHLFYFSVDSIIAKSPEKPPGPAP